MNPFLLLALLTLQTPKPTPLRPEVQAPTAPQLVSGVLPKETSAEAREMWALLVAALRPSIESDKPLTAITAFDLTIQTRVTSVQDGGTAQRNDFDLRYKFLSPGFVRTTLMDSGVERMRGPDGDWLWDAKKGDLIALAGREYAQDRRELSQTLSIARNYIALCDPAKLRIAKLELLSAPPAGLPQLDARAAKNSAVPLAASLVWIAITSPDFQVVETVKSTEAPMFKAQIGLDPKTHLPLLATIWQDENGTMAVETAVLVDFKTTKTNYARLDGRLVPTHFSVHDPLLPSSPFVFQSTQRVDVVVKTESSRLSPNLTAADFRPPKK